MANINPKIYTYPSLDSTNNEAKRLASTLTEDQLKTGLVIVADTQTAGRGQGDHIWHSDSEDGLYYSLLIKPSFTLEDIPAVVTSAAQSVIHVIQTLSGVHPTLKPPNDVMIDGKKVAGILLETAVEGHSIYPRYVVVGVGINLNHDHFSDLLSHVATSLYQQTGKPYDKALFAQALTDAFLMWLKKPRFLL